MGVHGQGGLTWQFVAERVFGGSVDGESKNSHLRYG